ncbi:TRAP transporter small permease subunit [Marinomonas mediterranea]|jgi:TRAP-type mannitol/chloroaromatic compound transport system, small permease component|uniref:TRAP transporter small permease protein n=1 Tax=Marinomonas mediterranea (strain ATCC 700492 / JCM 21426 / NBRC 103028 / MMB-1) TaxID=717774 RepID=F2JUK2_MARM1|nr:TRAP transporter small permease [Marinomonas mediterranea]ADZ89335.1 Tripartite ATP-independent periplasmic transporter DctQ component [Marinomonas mediterranea MMB-1]WCN07437.1 TRAP transporter small permease subunit [Marinomonas mediterranea]WCN11533.1 TRAP transporter small permease subunit [Marinomonas mediterranea]WCN15600.1 TRAP transporter small permease subunit [Marinomonas mediterranea MMB-1]
MITAAIRSYCLVVHKVVEFTGKSVSYVMPMLAFVVAFEVFSRYFLNKPTIWAYDLSLFMFGYIAALGGAYAQQRRAHINVDILYNQVSPRVRSIFNLLSFALAIFFMAIVLKMSIGKFEEAIEYNYRRQSEWAPHMHHYWVMMAVASVMLILQFSSDWMRDAYHVCTGTTLLPEFDIIDEED